MSHKDDSPVPLAEDTTMNDESRRSKENWDGSEAEFIEDDNSAEYKESQTGIKLSYTLKKNEIYSCIKHSGFSKSNIWKTIIKSSICFLIAVFFFYEYINFKKNSFLVLMLIAIIAVILIWIFPLIKIHRNANRLMTGKKLEVEIYPDVIEVYSDKNEWKITLDGSDLFEEFNNMLLIFLPNEKIFIIPNRIIEPDLLADIQAIITAGTTPRFPE